MKAYIIYIFVFMFVCFFKSMSRFRNCAKINQCLNIIHGKVLFYFIIVFL